MCGSRLEISSETAKEPSPAPRESSSQRGTPTSTSILGLDPEPVRGQPFQREPSIAGPSFLGIGDEPERPANKYSYLLDYEEPRRHRGLWVALVLLVAMALVGWQFRKELRARAFPLYSALMARVHPQPPAPPTPAATPAPADSTAPTTQSATGPNSDAAPTTGVISDTAQPPSNASASQPKPEDKAATAANAGEKPASAEPSKSDESVRNEAPTESPAPTKSARQPRKAAYAKRQAPAQSDVSSEDNRLLQLAQKYIHGQGIRADCRTGLAYLREATKHPNSAAASQMGALYATGTCVPLDRVNAYRWFTSALQMAPGNPWLARERDQLYALMSSTERRMADRQ